MSENTCKTCGRKASEPGIDRRAHAPLWLVCPDKIHDAAPAAETATTTHPSNPATIRQVRPEDQAALDLMLAHAAEPARPRTFAGFEIVADETVAPGRLELRGGKIHKGVRAASEAREPAIDMPTDEEMQDARERFFKAKPPAPASAGSDAGPEPHPVGWLPMHAEPAPPPSGSDATPKLSLAPEALAWEGQDGSWTRYLQELRTDKSKSPSQRIIEEVFHVYHHTKGDDMDQCRAAVTRARQLLSAPPAQVVRVPDRKRLADGLFEAMAATLCRPSMEERRICADYAAGWFVDEMNALNPPPLRSPERGDEGRETGP